ncbi:MAG TPA: ThuA domain-containing protein [Candidatus Limnocylindrales bacterium]|nr:ThuA domain-containing protein [Candidatus Limnocylindrales bacterium]
MRKAIGIASLITLVGSVLIAPAALSAPPDQASNPEYRVYVYTRGAPVALANAAVKAVRDLGKAHSFTVQSNGDPTQFTDENLARFRAVILLANSGNSLNAAQRGAFEDYFHAGGGVVSIGGAIEAETDWEFLTEVIGTRASSRTHVQPGTIKVADRVHDASKDVPEYWSWTDAWYNFEANVRGESHVLATVVELVDEVGSFEVQPWGERLTGIVGGTMGYDHPVSWCKDWRGGRSFYSAIGNSAAAFNDGNFRTYLAGAIRWAAGVSDPVYSDCGATVIANYQQTKITTQPNISEPIGFDVLPDGRVIQTDRRGGVRLHDPETNTTTLLAQIPVYMASEDGMYGPGIDNDFATNRWVYLYYSPPTVKDVKLSDGSIVTQTTPTGNAPNTGASYSVWDPWVGYFQLSRFKFVDATATTPAHLDVTSEEEILRVPQNRGACCHVAGDIDFDRHNNLWLVTGDDTPAGGGNSGGFGPFNDMITAAGLFNAPHVDARRSSQNTNDLRGKILRITVKEGAIAPEEANQLGGAYTVPDGNLFAVGQEKTRPEIYAMGFRNPFRIQVDDNDVAYITDYSPDSQTPTNFRGPAGTGRFMVVREPSNYGWPLCYKTDLPYYRWNFNTSQPLDSPPQVHECNNPTRGPLNDSRWNLGGGPTVEPGLEFGPPVTNPEMWYSFTPENRAVNPLGTPCFEYYNGSGTTNCPRVFPELLTGGVGPHGAAAYTFDPDNPDETKFPPYYDGSVFFGEFTRDFLREIRLDSHGRIQKINRLLDCGQANVVTPFPFECDNPMDLQFDDSGHFYLLTYGDGFFNINQDAGLYRWDYVKGTRTPVVSLSASPTSGAVPLTVQFSSEGSFDPDPGESISFAWDFDGNGTIDSMDPHPSHTYTAIGQFTARLTVTDSSGKSSSANTTITVGNTAPAIVIDAPVDGGLFAFGESIPWAVTVNDPEDGAIDCSRVEVTFVLGHDEHGHAQETQTGCSGVLPTIADDVSHGGNVFGVISASYTDLGGPGGVPALTTVEQVQVRQKRQEVEFVIEQQGTNVQTTNDPGGGGQHRGSMSNNDWLLLNGSFNLQDIDALTFRIASTGTAIPAGNPLAAVDVRLDTITGPLLLTANLTSTGNAATWQSQSFPITDPGGAHSIFLVVRSIPGGATGNNLFNLNWVQFEGDGISTLP